MDGGKEWSRARPLTVQFVRVFEAHFEENVAQNSGLHRSNDGARATVVLYKSGGFRIAEQEAWNEKGGKGLSSEKQRMKTQERADGEFLSAQTSGERRMRIWRVDESKNEDCWHSVADLQFRFFRSLGESPFDFIIFKTL